jgi:sarcosine oxidase subunit beta
LKKYSFMSIVKEAFKDNLGWQKAWSKSQPKKEYEVIIVGGGGHGLATAYYLAKNFNVTDIAVIEKGWIGGGNTGRNTTIIRSNYLQESSIGIYEKSRSLYETLSQDLNYNIMFSPRGVLMLCQTEHELRAMKRTCHANRINGVDTKMVSPDEVKEIVPIINIDGPRFPVLGALWQPRGGTARHDAVAWGYARKCSDYGIDIIEQCEVIGVKKKREKVMGLETTRGQIKAKKVCFVVAGHSSVLADLAGFRLPIESVALQALVSEPIKPIINCVVMANTVHGYLSQSDKGELVIGGGADGYNNYSQRGSFLHIEETVRALVETFPVISRLRQLRQWGGIVDMTGDRSPIISKTPVEGLYINCGWGTGGFKAIPGSGWATAEMINNEQAGKLAAPFSMDRFSEGRLIDESAAAAVAH